MEMLNSITWARAINRVLQHFLHNEAVLFSGQPSAIGSSQTTLEKKAELNTGQNIEGYMLYGEIRRKDMEDSKSGLMRRRKSWLHK
jgi:hypothetical protein